MRMPRVRMTIRRIAIAVAVAACASRSVRLLDLRGRSHRHLHLAQRCGCVVRPVSPAIRRHHDRMAKLFGFLADLQGEPLQRCGIPILDPIPGEPE